MVEADKFFYISKDSHVNVATIETKFVKPAGSVFVKLGVLLEAIKAAEINNGKTSPPDVEVKKAIADDLIPYHSTMERIEEVARTRTDIEVSKLYTILFEKSKSFPESQINSEHFMKQQ